MQDNAKELSSSRKSNYSKSVQSKRNEFTSLWDEIKKDRKEPNLYTMTAFCNDSYNRYALQFSNNFMTPVYYNSIMSLSLYNFLKIPIGDPVLVFMEEYIISDAMMLKNLIEYYRNTPLMIVEDPAENIIAGQDVLNSLSAGIFPTKIRVINTIELNKHKEERRIYVPNLNITIYKDGRDLRYAGEHPMAKEHKNSFNISPRTSGTDINLYQHYFKIINNEEAGKKYYIRLLNKVIEIESTPSMLGTESSCIKTAFFQESREINQSKIDLTEENLKLYGIYNTRIEAENIHDINKIIENKKIDLALNNLNISGTDLIFKTMALNQGFDLRNKKHHIEEKRADIDLNKIELDKKRLELDEIKLSLDREKLELEFDKLYKEVKLLERGYRNDIGKLSIGIIKEVTDAISVIIRLTNIVKGLFSKE